MKKLLFFAAMSLMALSMSAQDDYIDLGLLSGTLWKRTAEQGFYTYDEAMSEFQDHLPTKEQFEELIKECIWTWTGAGYKVEGPNMNIIYLPATGYRHCLGSVYNVGSVGSYWSSSLDVSEIPFDLYLSSESVSLSSGICYGSVLLVSK